MLVKEIMTTAVKTIRPEDTVKKLAEGMVKYKIGSLVVVSGSGEVVGIATERDVIEHVIILGKSPEEVRVQEVMTKDMITINPSNTLEEAADIMVHHEIKKLPVIEGGRLVGIVTATDLIAYENKLVEKIAHLIMASPMRSIGG
ncbi:MAG: CBS domain-containing protein [Candidatus Aenigmarchaeota archaeon]|nr:CBS domain-containing protein [Candidatus Aenigmarchaeota archaeon]NIO44058.1 CBS domain-containing protein [Candidatus Aenigmarchaeota archaeon]